MKCIQFETFGLKSTDHYFKGDKLFCEKSVVIKLNSSVLKQRSFANLK